MTETPNPDEVEHRIFWLSEEFLAALDEEIKASQEGRTEDLGSFAQYAEDDDDEP